MNRYSGAIGAVRCHGTVRAARLVRERHTGLPGWYDHLGGTSMLHRPSELEHGAGRAAAGLHDPGEPALTAGWGQRLPFQESQRSA